MAADETRDAQTDRPESTTDPGMLDLDLSLKVEPRAAPNPLREARPDRIEHVRRAVRNIVAARRAGVAGGDPRKS